MFGNAWRVGRIAGVDIRIDASWVIIALLITYSLFFEFRLELALEAGPALALAAGTAFLFFGSVLTHEMAHALMSRRRKIPVEGITLFLFGGATHAKVESRKPKDEFLISVVGPLTSLGLALLFYGAAWATRAVLAAPMTDALALLAIINLALAVFNLLPGFPLDGGRVLRSIVWQVTGNLSRATRVASIAGQTMGYLMVGTGAVVIFTLGNLVGGIWFAAIGWFLAQAARASQEQIEVRRMLRGVEAEDLMTEQPISIPRRLTIREAVDDYFLRYDHGAFPVEDGDRSIGLLTLRGVKKVPREEWDTRRVEEVMGPIDDECSVATTAPMDRVLSKIQEGDAHRCLVLRDGEVVGIITASDVARWLQRRRALEV